MANLTLTASSPAAGTLTEICRAAWQIPCRWCYSLRGDACDGGGAHMLRLAAAYRAGLVSERDFNRTVASLVTFSPGTVIRDGGQR